MYMAPHVRQAQFSDFKAIAAVHREAFPRQHDSEVWVKATLAASPRMLAFVLVLENSIAGYIFWAQKSGIRPSAVLELDQIAVLPNFRNMGYGEHLIRESLAMVNEGLSANGQSVKSLLVSTRADNDAQRLYTKALGAKVVASIDGLYSATEVFMLAEYPNA